MKNLHLLVILYICVGMMNPSSAFSSPRYSITITGFTDTEHTRDDGYRFSADVYQMYNDSSLNQAGQVIGTAQRFNGGATSLGQSAWLYSGGTTTNIGLTDTEHTRDDGYRYSSYIPGYNLNQAGQVIGTAQRFNGGATSLGQSAWLYSGGTTTNIGLTDTEHTRDDGYRYSTDYLLNQAGQVLGYSQRYNGGATSLGQSAWLYSGGTTTNIGLTDTEHTRNDGIRDSQGSWLNEAGQVIGTSKRYNGGATSLGQSAWLYSGGTTTNIGLTDTEHTRNDGYRSSDFQNLNQAGQVLGSSQRYNGDATPLGRSVWLYSGGTTTNIGLTDTEHTRDDGYREIFGYRLNEAGQVLGSSQRFNGGATSLGQSAWLYSGGTTTNIGLTDTEHTRNDGYRFSSAHSYLNEAGQVIGTAQRFNGGATSLGQSAWLYSGGTTTNIGLTDTEHTRDDGYRSSDFQNLNQAGQVLGSSQRYNGGATSLGQSAWLYSGGTTTNIGLTDTEHTRNDGYRFSMGISAGKGLNEAGQVAGYAERFNGGATSLGISAWLYDSAIDQTYGLDLSIRSDGYAYSFPTYLGEDGLMLGLYNLYGEDDTFLGTRAFSFTLSDGLFDLGSLINGGLDASGWSSLADALRSNTAGQIAGHGLLSDMTNGQMSYVLNPQAVPISPTAWLFCSGLLGLIGIARRKKAA